MRVFNCKACGAPLDIMEGMTVCECGYCGTLQSLPKIGDEARLAAINRANHYRQNGEFDKAEKVYEELIEQEKETKKLPDKKDLKKLSERKDLSDEKSVEKAEEKPEEKEDRSADAELFWSLALCRYGIEYVTDPATKKRVPTCHRLQYKSILDDDDYLRAITYADEDQKKAMMAEARYISNVQARILEIAKKEDPFDVFICYKESDDAGTRTKDSVLAQDLYYELIREGYKVFFSRITLEGKLGTEYEPYIFAALHSAKVMIVVGTSKMNLEATWVRNEWLRYLAIMKEDRNRKLIPAYQDMDPYDLPDALSMLQAQDMSKLGFMQDILDNVNRLVHGSDGVSPVKRQTLVVSDVTGTAPLLRRISYFLEDGEWDRAAQYCDRVLNLDPECAQAYVYTLMGEKKVHTWEELEDVMDHNGVNTEDSYRKAIRFADPELKEKLKRLDQQMIYNDAMYKLRFAAGTTTAKEALQEFASIPGFKDADEKFMDARKRLVRESIDEAKQIWEEAEAAQESLKYNGDRSVADKYLEAAEKFDALATKNIDVELFSEEEREELQAYKQSAAESANECRYRAACIEMKIASSGAMMRVAYNRFIGLGSYKDSRKKAEECQNVIYDEKYKSAASLLQWSTDPEELQRAARVFESLGDFKDARELAEKCLEKAGGSEGKGKKGFFGLFRKKK